MRGIKKGSSITKGIKRAAITAFTLLTAVYMSACSGGGGGGTDFTLDQGTAVVNKGVIEKFGSIFVNGVEFKTDGAIVHLRDDKTDKNLTTDADVKDFLKSGLKIGMVVTVKGTVNADGITGHAQEVEFRNTLKAKIDSVDLVHNTITVMGQTIAVDDPAQLTGADALKAGDIVEISGLPDDNGRIKATHLEKKAGVAEFEAKGFVKLITGSTTSFKLLLSPNAPDGITVTLPAGVALPADGSFIEVKTALTAAGGTITATNLEVETELHAAENQKVSVEGFPASGTVADFLLNGQRVQTTATTLFVGGIKDNFTLARKLEAQGTIVGGILIAEKITFKVVNGGISKGAIEKFGSLFVNGVEFKTQGAMLHLRDDKTTPDRVLQTEAEIATLLKPGMVVSVKGGFDNNGTTGIAQEIEFRNTLEGTIDDKGVDFVTVLGQKIAVDDPAKLVGLVVGDKVGLSGLPDDLGRIRATHIEKKDLAEFEAKGFITGLTAAAFTLKLDKNAASGMTVTLGSGVTLPAGAVEGSFVEVRTATAAGGAVTATKVELQNELQAAENENMEFEGFIASGTADDFVIKGQHVQTTATTAFIGGIKTDLLVGMKVEAEGKIVGGVLIATKVMFKDNIRIDAIVSAVNAATATTQMNLTLLGHKVVITGATDLKDNSTPSNLTLASVAAGQEVQVRGVMAVNGDIIATRLTLIDAAPNAITFRPFLRGPVTAKDAVAGTLTIAGIAVNTVGASFIDNKATVLTAADLFAKVIPNTTAVKVTWNPSPANTAVVVREAELEI
jgi:Domain of unknown function (DUF5666)